MGDQPADRWQSKITSIQKGVSEIFIRGLFCDVSIWIKEQEFPAHRLLLGARSPVFRNLLLGSNAEDNVYIKDESITITGFDILLRFIYTNEIGTEDKKSIIEAYLAANYFDQSKLQLECERRIESWALTKDDVWQILSAGYTLPAIRYKCITFIKSDVNDILSAPSFLNIGLGCLNTLFYSEVLKEVPAMQLLTKIMEWAAKHYVTHPGDYAPVRKVLEKNGLLSKLGIETLNLEELTTVVNDYGNLLTSAEVVMFMNYSRKKDALCLPSWCNEEK